MGTADLGIVNFSDRRNGLQAFPGTAENVGFRKVCWIVAHMDSLSDKLHGHLEKFVME